MPYLRTLSAFRDTVREMAREQKPHAEFLKLSDKLRDVDLVDLGVSLDDQEGTWDYVKLKFIAIESQIGVVTIP